MILEVSNIEVTGLERAVNAINSSFNVGEINTVAQALSDRSWKVAKSLGSNFDAHQSHDAYLKGINVSFELKASVVVMLELMRYHFMSIKPIEAEKDLEFTDYVDPEMIEQVNNLAQEAFQGDLEKYEKYLYNLPRGVLKKYFITTNYLQLKTICIQRAKHRHNEAYYNLIKAFFDLPRFKELCGFQDWKLEEMFPIAIQFVLQEKM